MAGGALPHLSLFEMAIVVSTSSTDASLSKEKVLMDDGN
jgi:hypothetical protein